MTCKIHVLCDAQGQPLHFHLTAGHTHESTVLDDVLVGADEQRIDADGNPVAWPVALAADKGYRADWIDAYLLRPTKIVMPGRWCSIAKRIGIVTSSNA